MLYMQSFIFVFIFVIGLQTYNIGIYTYKLWSRHSSKLCTHGNGPYETLLYSRENRQTINKWSNRLKYDMKTMQTTKAIQRKKRMVRDAILD